LEAADPQKAISLVEQHQGQIDLLITDVVMPDINGPHLAERIKAIRPGIRVLFISGYTGRGLAQRGLADKDVKLLVKPFGAQALVGAVEEMLRDGNTGRPGTRCATSREPSTKDCCSGRIGAS
jgi:YesN/AraC family two-component response regulator